MKIPKELCKPSFRFIKLGHPDSDWAKRPIEKQWTTINNYSYDSPYFKPHLEGSFNYGVLTGYGNLLVIDFDDLMFQTRMIKYLPPTFTVKTARKGLKHLYYLVDKVLPKFPIRDEKGKTLADIQCVGGQVVGPNSYNKQNIYKVQSYNSKLLHTNEVSHITLSKLKEVFGTVWKPIKKKATLILPKKIITKGSTSLTKNILSIKQFLHSVHCEPIKGHRGLYIDPVCGITGNNKYNFQASNDGWYSYHSMIGGRKTVSLIMYYYGIDNVKEGILKYHEILSKQ